MNLQGIDLVTLNDDGEIAKLDVLIRPANAVDALREVVAQKIGAFLASLNAKDDA